MIAAMLLLACRGPARDMAGCGELRRPAEREDCRLRVAREHAGDRAALAALVEQVPEPLSADLLRLRLAVDDPVHLGWLCAGVHTRPARRKCRQVVGRPHLKAAR